jgi:hypothetical protein
MALPMSVENKKEKKHEWHFSLSRSNFYRISGVEKSHELFQ